MGSFITFFLKVPQVWDTRMYVLVRIFVFISVSCDGDGGVMGSGRRGFLPLRVVLQMLTWPQRSCTCGDDRSYPLIPVTAPVTQGHSGV